MSADPDSPQASSPAVDATAGPDEPRILEALDSSPDALIVLDPRGCVTWASSATLPVLGWRPDELVGQPITVVALDEDVEQQQHLLAEAARTGRPTSYSARRRRRDGGVVEVSVSLAPVRAARSTSFAGICATVRPAGQRSERLQARLAEQEHLNLTLSRRSSDVALITKPDTEITYVSPPVYDVLGFSPDQLLGSKSMGLVHRDDRVEVQAFVTRVASSPDSVERKTFRIHNARGEWRWIELTLTNCIDLPGVEGLVANLRDVSNEFAARAALVASEQRYRATVHRYRAIVETAQEGVLVLDQETRVLFANKKASELLGHPPGDIDRRKLTGLLDGTTAEHLRGRTASHSARGHERYEISYAHPDGRSRVFEISSSPISLGVDAGTGSLAMISDVTEARRVQAELQHRALHDPLTGLPNRALFHDRLSMALCRQGRDPDRPGVALLSIDLDGFRLVNHVHGHEVSDAILVEVAERLRGVAEEADTVARLEGDHFVVVVEGAGTEAAAALGDRMRRVLLEPVRTADSVVYVDASVGVAVTPPQSPASLLRSANTALHRAKTQGRGRVLLYDASWDDELDPARELQVANALREALNSGEIGLGYQPVVDLADGRVVAVEALLRWEHPDLGAVPPTEVVATAHSIGWAERLNRYVLRRACTEMAQLRERGVAADLTLAVNLSPQSFDSGLPRAVEEASRLSGWPLNRLSLEITEGVLMRDPGAAAVVLARLRELDVSVAIDDFGTGFSSLAYLQRLPVGALKVDRRFVEHVPADPDACAIARAIIDLARALSLDTVAEGIETQDQADYMRALGCRWGQGYLWSPAVPPTQLAALLLARPT